MKKNPWFSSFPSSQSSPCSTQPHPEGRRRADTARGGDSCLETGSRNGEVKHTRAAARPHLHSGASLGHTSSHNVPSTDRLQPAFFSLHVPWRGPALCLWVSPRSPWVAGGEGWKATKIQTGTEAWNLPVGFLPLAESSQAGCRNRIHIYLYIYWKPQGIPWLQNKQPFAQGFDLERFFLSCTERCVNYWIWMLVTGWTRGSSCDPGFFWLCAN